jgi:putative nucleotidyltransferase with HDIG domain
MRIIDIDHLKPKMRIGKTIYSENGNILLSKNTVLKENYIKRLKEKNIPAIYIDDELSKGIESKSIVSIETKIKAINTIKGIYDSVDPTKKDQNKKILSPEAYLNLKDTIEKIMEEIKNNHDLSFNMVELLSTDLYTYTHSVNVTILSLMMSNVIGYSEADQFKIGMGCLLHDIGKVLIDDEILHKKGVLTKEEFSQMKRHSEYGYEMIKDNNTLTPMTKNIVLLHHEKLDGSGYPYQLKGEAVKEHVRIATIADIFDAVTSTRVYSKEVPVYKGLELVSSYAPTLIDEKLYHILSKKIAPYPPGTTVLLSNHYKGIVCGLNKDHPTRPIIKVIYNDRGEALKENLIIDLMKDLTLFVDKKIELD